MRIAPGQAFNAARETPGSFEGWHDLTTQVSGNEVRSHVDGHLVAGHGGRHVPVQPMSLNLSLLFSTGGLLAASPGAPRRWAMELAGALHVADALLDPGAVRAQVRALRAAGTRALDTVLRDGPALRAPCDL